MDGSSCTVQGNRSPDKRASVSIIGTNDFTKSPIRHALDTGIGLPPVSSVPREGQGAKETSLRTNELAINFLPAIGASLARAFRARLRARGDRLFANYPPTRFPINDLLARSGYTLEERS
ncbi:hypothetical protein HN011_011644 [Eciton burchellii]|nr:hypothetical protein HN011_011644 [Eciton burchellii]